MADASHRPQNPLVIDKVSELKEGEVPPEGRYGDNILVTSVDKFLELGSTLITLAHDLRTSLLRHRDDGHGGVALRS